MKHSTSAWSVSLLLWGLIWFVILLLAPIIYILCLILELREKLRKTERFLTPQREDSHSGEER